MGSYPMQKVSKFKIHIQPSLLHILFTKNSVPDSAVLPCNILYADFVPTRYLPPSCCDNPPPLICLLQILSLLVFPGSSRLFLLVQNTFPLPLISGDIWGSLTDLSSSQELIKALKNKGIPFT